MKKKILIASIIVLVIAIAALVVIALSYAKVSFILGNGEENLVVKVKKGNLVTRPEDPVFDGYKFIDWKLDGESYNFSTIIEKDIVIKAAYVKVAKVSFDAQNGEEALVSLVEIGYRVEKPEDPDNQGYGFAGWTLDGELFDFDTIIREDIVLKARWETSLISPTSVKLNKSVYNLVDGGTENISYTLSPDNINTNSLVTFNSLDDRIVVVDKNGKMTAIAPGKAIVTVTTQNGKVGFATVYVDGSYLAVDKDDANSGVFNFDKNNDSIHISFYEYSYTKGTRTVKDNSKDVKLVISEEYSKYVSLVKENNEYYLKCNQGLIKENISIELSFKTDSLNSKIFTVNIKLE